MLECWPFSGSDSIYFNQKSASRLRHELSSGTRYWSSSTLCALCSVLCALCSHAVHCAVCGVSCAVLCTSLRWETPVFSNMCRLVWPDTRLAQWQKIQNASKGKKQIPKSTSSLHFGQIVLADMQDQFVKIATMSNTKFHDILPIYMRLCVHICHRYTWGLKYAL